MRMTLLIAILALTGCGYAWAQNDARELEIERRFDKIIVLEFDRGQMIDEALFTKIRDELETASLAPSTAVVIDIDSGGGLVDAAKAISDLIRSFRELEDFRVFAYVGPGEEAISAAAWIALSCRGLLIASDAVIGDIQPISWDGSGAFRDVPEKIVTKTTEDVWIAARNNGLARGYPELFVKAMVDRDLDIYAVRDPQRNADERFLRASEFRALSESQRDALRIEEITLPGKALTTNGADLLRFGFAVKLINNRDQLIDILGEPGATVEVKSLGIRSPLDFEGFFMNWGILLLFLGIAGLVLEFQSPGLGIFGIGGVLCLIAFFLVQADFSDAAILPIALLMVGALLVLIEVVLLPGLIAPGLLGIGLILYATWLGIARPQDGGFVMPDFASPEGRDEIKVWAFGLVACFIVAATTSVLLGRFIHRLPWIGKAVIVPPRETANAELLASAIAPKKNADLELGQSGVALTDLRPSGSARIANRKIDVVSRGAFIPVDSPIVIVEIKGMRVVVRALDEVQEA